MRSCAAPKPCDDDWPVEPGWWPVAAPEAAAAKENAPGDGKLLEADVTGAGPVFGLLGLRRIAPPGKAVLPVGVVAELALTLAPPADDGSDGDTIADGVSFEGVTGVLPGPLRIHSGPNCR